MNLSKQLPAQIEQIENTTQRLGVIWQQQSQSKKWLLGISAIVVAGLVMTVTRKRALPAFAQLLFSVSTVIFRLKDISQFGENEKSITHQ